MAAIEFNNAFWVNAKYMKRLALRPVNAALYYQGDVAEPVEALQKQKTRQQIEYPMIMVQPPKHAKMEVFST